MNRAEQRAEEKRIEAERIKFWKDNQENIYKWIKERCEVGEMAFRECSEELYKNYSEYTIKKELFIRSQKHFIQQLLKSGLFKAITHMGNNRGKRGLMGIRLKSRPEEKSCPQPRPGQPTTSRVEIAP